MRVWLRVGDNAEYESYDSMEEAAEYLSIITGGGPICWRGNGFTMPGFEGENYVSLYWGDEEGNYLESVDFIDRYTVKNAMLLEESECV